MKTTVICYGCGTPITISGSHGTKEVSQPLPCPACGHPNEVLWPMDQGWTVEPPQNKS